MKSQRLYLLIAILLVIGISQQSWVYYQKNHGPVDLPTVSFLDEAKQNRTLKEVGTGRNTLVVIYQKDCEFCKRELTSMNEQVADFAALELVFLSMDSWSEMMTFKAQYFPQSTDNILFGAMAPDQVNMLLGDDALAYPYFLFFDETGRLKVRHKGLVSVQKILETIDRV